jgi:glycerol-3-phosphate dehydrogenase
VRLTKGVHLVVSAARLPVRNSIVLSDEAGRIVFVMPREGWVTIGTTDTDFDGDRERVAANDADIDYLLAVVNRALPGVGLTGGDVAYAFAGLRALEIGEGGRAPSSVSREEITIESTSGLISIAGGKLTTHREIAQKIVDNVMRRTERSPGVCPTLTTPLPGARKRDVPANLEGVVPPDIARILVGRYGSRAAMILAIVGEHRELAARIVPGAPAIRAEVVHALRSEMATSISDFLVRRTSMVWRDPAAAVAAAPEVARIMGVELGWSPERIARETARFFARPGLREGAATPMAEAVVTESREDADGRNAVKGK